MNTVDEKNLIEQFAKMQADGFFPCPRCGRMTMSSRVSTNALSRRADCYVCDACGMEEALEDMSGEARPLESWAIVKDPASWRVSHASAHLELTLIGRDSWDRPVYNCGGTLYVDINPMSKIPPEICTKSGNEFNGEPMDPISADIDISFIPYRDTWDKDYCSSL